MRNHKKKLMIASLLFVGMLGFNAIKAEAAATVQDVQNLRYCTIDNIYKTSRADCPLRQDRLLDRLDEDRTTRPRNGKQDGTGSGRADHPRIADCPSYAAKQTQATPAPTAEPTTTAYSVQPQDGTGNQYAQQNRRDDSAQVKNDANQPATQAQQSQQQVQQPVQQEPIQQQQIRQHQQSTNQTSQNQAPAQQQQNRVHHNNTPKRTGGHQGQHH
ncbi:hypothetical protein [Enterococcus sp. DIV0756]|uniref:hypothetical protein n=1 Tax=Enterococcus sp. DIV0756 TaxID=2774636 RepID=UPI003F21DCCA